MKAGLLSGLAVSDWCQSGLRVGTERGCRERSVSALGRCLTHKNILKTPCSTPVSSGVISWCSYSTSGQT